MEIQVKIENKESCVILTFDFRDFDHIKWLLEAAWNSGYDTYLRRLGEGEEDGG
ncbi:hypothetical protein [Hungatella effluvii]|jgi:hypothetical protein|uniref:hypothetical protein n=1 Tax=Hungatella effluvii TaxID=1096246 RepID=UPI002A82E60A|nr:hypothetical protein [Hungatella effluvii]